MKLTIAQIRRANEGNGGKFFSRENTRFSRTLPTVYGGKFFVTADRYGDMQTQFKVWHAVEGGGDIRKADEPSTFKSLDLARDRAKALAREVALIHTDKVDVTPGIGTDPADTANSVQGRREKLRRLLAVVKSVTDDNDTATRVSDLLADIRHLCDWHGLDFAECDRKGHANYTAEPKMRAK